MSAGGCSWSVGFSPDARGCSRRGPLGVFLVFSLAKCAGRVLHPRKGSSARGFSSEIQIHSDLRLLIYLFIFFFSSERRGECWCSAEVFGSLGCTPSNVNLQELLGIHIPGASAVPKGTQSPLCLQPPLRGREQGPQAGTEHRVEWGDEPVLCQPSMPKDSLSPCAERGAALGQSPW